MQCLRCFYSRGGGRGGVSNCLFPIETHITCDFPGGVRTPCPPSGSALEGGETFVDKALKHSMNRCYCIYDIETLLVKK